MNILNHLLNKAAPNDGLLESDFVAVDWDFRSGVILTSYRNEGRIERLQLVYCALEEFSPNAAQKIGRLHDHKGFLAVFWLNEPTFKDRRIVEIVWSSSVAREREEHVEHILWKGFQL